MDARFENWPNETPQVTRASDQTAALNPKSALASLRRKRAGAVNVYKGATLDRSKGVKWVKVPLDWTLQEILTMRGSMKYVSKARMRMNIAVMK